MFMIRFFAIVTAMLLLLAGLAGASHAQSEVALKSAFVRELQKAIRNDDMQWLADHIQYPLRHHGRVATVIRNRADFVRNYPVIISDKLRATILAQVPEKIFENWQGVMIGDGGHNIWLRESGEGSNIRYEIVTINDVP